MGYREKFRKKANGRSLITVGEIKGEKVGRAGEKGFAAASSDVTAS
jgi:hypothetical protein